MSGAQYDKLTKWAIVYFILQSDLRQITVDYCSLVIVIILLRTLYYRSTLRRIQEVLGG